MDGLVHWPGGGPVLRFVRTLRRPLDEVWERLVDPRRLAEWPGPTVVEPVVGGRVYLELTELVGSGELGGPLEGRVRRLVTSHLLEHSCTGRSMGDGGVRWCLTRWGRGTRLVLHHRVTTRTDLSRLLAGWHLRLDLLLVSFELGRTVWLPDRYERLRRHYAEAATARPWAGCGVLAGGSAPAASARPAGAGRLQQEIG